MNKLLKVAVATLVAASVLLGGCATPPDPDRPFLEQPSVTADVQRELASKKIQEIPVYVSSRVIYYDASKYMELAWKVKKETKTLEEKLKFSWVKEFPTILDPPVNSSLVSNAAKVVAAANAVVKGRGFGVIDIPCQECLIVLFDYAEYWKIEPVPIPLFQKEQRTFFWFVRVRLYYKGQEVAIGHSDTFNALIEGLIPLPGINLDNTLKRGSGIAINDVFRALNLNIASWRQRLSAIQ